MAPNPLIMAVTLVETNLKFDCYQGERTVKVLVFAQSRVFVLTDNLYYFSFSIKI